MAEEKKNPNEPSSENIETIEYAPAQQVEQEPMQGIRRVEYPVSPPQSLASQVGSVAMRAGHTVLSISKATGEAIRGAAEYAKKRKEQSRAFKRPIEQPVHIRSRVPARVPRPRPQAYQFKPRPPRQMTAIDLWGVPTPKKRMFYIGRDNIVRKKKLRKY